MEQRFTDYFATRLDESRSGETAERAGLPDGLRLLLNEALDQASASVEGTGKQLRPDGALALHLGFQELVARPLAMTQSVAPGELRDLVFTDVEHVAVRAAAESDEQEVSSHAIVTAVAQAWPELQIAKMPYW